MNVIPLFREYVRRGYYPFWREGMDEYWAKLQNVLDKAREMSLSSAADLCDPDGNHFEIGGKNKKPSQLPPNEPGYLLVDNIEIGSGGRIPLYLTGFLY
jgi:hypothetical protein